MGAIKADHMMASQAESEWFTLLRPGQPACRQPAYRGLRGSGARTYFGL